MRYIAIMLLMSNFQLLNAAVFSESYEEKLKQFNEERQSDKSTMSDEDKLVMKNAGEYLMKYLPNPGFNVGDKAPNFILNNAFGKTVNLEDELKKGPVVLVFYRGSWCPYCNLHLHTLQQRLPEFTQYGARLITVTPQKPDKSAEQLKEDGYNFEVLSDLDSSVMKDYNLYFELPDDLVTLYKKFGINIETYNGNGRNVLPVPGSFVIDQKGVIRATQSSTDYKKRMEPKAMVKALKMIASENQSNEVE